MHRRQHDHASHAHEQSAHESTATTDDAHLRVASGTVPPVASAASSGGGARSASEHGYMHHHGGDRNVSMLSINKHHREKNGPGEQSTRVAWGGKDPELAHDSDVYDDAGTVIGHQPAGRVPVNAGQISHLMIPGHEHAVACVLTHGSPPGWIPVSKFEHAERLKHEQMRESAAIRHHRHQATDLHADHDHPGPRFVIRDLPMPSEYADAFTKPHQHAPVANRAVDYFVRPNHHVNFLLNLPTWHENGHSEGERLGSADSIVPAVPPGQAATPASTFHKLHGPVAVQLYKHNSATHHGKLHFVYGYITNDAGEKRFGWINEALLEAI